MTYIEGIVKILEIPKQSFLNNSIIMTTMRAQLPQLQSFQIVTLIFWGSLVDETNKYYKVNDYIIIEGYLSFKSQSKLNLNFQVPKQVEITILKVYPFLLNFD